MTIGQELLAEEVGQGVIFLVEGEYCGVGGTCEPIVSNVRTNEQWINYGCRSSPRSSSHSRREGRLRY